MAALSVRDPVSDEEWQIRVDLAALDRLSRLRGVALDLDERERIVADLGERRFMLLRNHGSLTVGPTICAAWMAMYYLERACTMQVRAPVDGSVDELTWPALLRRLYRVDDSHRHDSAGRSRKP